MFEKEIKFINDFCLNKISKAGSFLTFEKLRGIEIHPAILKYISSEIDHQIYLDRQVLLRNSEYDYSGTEVSKYFRMIAQEIKKSKRISESEIHDLISQAVTFNVSYTTKPNETLVDFIFKESDSKSPDEIMMILDYLYYYNYLGQILSSYLYKKQLLTLDKKDLESLLYKIDSELFPVKANELIDNALDAMADFLNIGAVLRSQIPTQAIDNYLKEKKLIDYYTRLEYAVTQTPKTNYGIDEIRKIIYSNEDIPGKKDEAPRYEVPPVYDEALLNSQNVSVSDNLTSEVKIDIHNNFNPTEKIEIDKIELEELELVNPDAEKPIDLSEEITIEEDIETFNVDADELEETSSEKVVEDYRSNTISQKDILSHLTDKEIERIISSVFNEDKEDFATTIETISECKTYEKATEILKSLYTTYSINPYSRDAIRLTNAVAKYFTTA
jgi:hypothetical protein